MATKPDKYRPEHAGELLYQLSKASQQGEPAGAILKLAEKREALRVAIAAYAPLVGTSARKLADSLRPLVGQTFAYEGEQLTLKSRYVNRRHETQFCVDGSLRLRIIKARAKAEQRETSIKEQAHELAKALRRNPDPLEAVRAVAPLYRRTDVVETIPPVRAPTASEQALEETKRAGWFTPRESPVRVSPPVPMIEPEPVRAPAPIAPSTARRPGESMPDYIRRTGIRPDYRTPTRVEPWNLHAFPPGARPASGPEVSDFSLSDVEREARKPKKWSPF